MSRMKASIRIAAATVAVVGTACASTGQSSDPADLVGCYYFEQGGAAASLNLPWGFRLLVQDLDGWPALQRLEEVRLATTLTGQDEIDHPFGYWRPLPGDSILVGYPAGGGVSLRLAPDDKGMSGVAQPVGDATLSTSRPSHPIQVVHARCPEDL